VNSGVGGRGANLTCSALLFVFSIGVKSEKIKGGEI